MSLSDNTLFQCFDFFVKRIHFSFVCRFINAKAKNLVVLTVTCQEKWVGMSGFFSNSNAQMHIFDSAA